jgi:peptidoglycan hydrolase-like protein with peptidoglycan-binding domain
VVIVIRGVQEEFQFRNLSGDPGKGLQVDGIFGSKTDAAVRGFQQALHQDVPSVTVDGIVGPVTGRPWSAECSPSDRGAGAGFARHYKRCPRNRIQPSARSAVQGARTS